MPLTNIQVEKSEGSRQEMEALRRERAVPSIIPRTGHKWWRFKYRFGARADGKPGKAEKNLVARRLPPRSHSKRAREKRDEALATFSPTTSIPALSRKQEEHQRRSRPASTRSRPWPVTGSQSRAGVRATRARNARRLSSTCFRGWARSAASEHQARPDQRGFAPNREDRAHRDCPPRAATD